MVSAAHSSERDDVFQIARSLVREGWEHFVRAGQQIDEIYSEDLVRRDDELPLGPGEEYAVEETFEFLRFKRLATAVQCFRFPQNHLYDNHFDFESNAPVDERKQSARRGILVMLAAADPEKDQVFTDELGVLANTPYEMESEGDLPGFGGSDWISWGEDGWDEQNEPSPRVLNRLRHAIDVVRQGNVQAARLSRIPTGDGRPCDEPCVNPYDEMHRALRDLLRHIDVFAGNAEQWLETHQYDLGIEQQEQREWLLSYTRQWWGTWKPAVNRIRDAIPNAQRSELKDFNTETLMALAKLNGIFSEAVAYLPHEQPGDHLLVRPLSVLGFQREDDRYLVSNYPREQVREAARPIQRHLEALALFLDQEVDEIVLSKPRPAVEPKIKPSRELTKKPMSYETATVNALAIARAEGWPRRNGKLSVRRMAQKVGCSPHTLAKALDNSKELRHLKDRDMVAQPTSESELARLVLEQEQDDKSDRV